MGQRSHTRPRWRFLRTSLPDSADGIEKYLSSGDPRRWPDLRQKLVRAFADKVFDVIGTTPDRLRESSGSGQFAASIRRLGRTEGSAKSWCSCTATVSAGAGGSDFQTYGSDAIRS
jgi:exodeoxyribonuclease V alpha subunit